MKAMILAAGLGTRLRPLTDERPKALVEVAGRTLLEITLRRLRSFGVREVIINVHHFADMVVEYLKEQRRILGCGLRSRGKKILLDTGGGLKKAACFFLRQRSSTSRSFCTTSMSSARSIWRGWWSFTGGRRRWRRWRCSSGRARDISCSTRRTSSAAVVLGKIGSQKLFDRSTFGTDPEALAFSGVHVISPRLLARITEDGVFSIITSYLRLAGAGEKIVAFRADEYYWRDLGTVENLKHASGKKWNKASFESKENPNHAAEA